MTISAFIALLPALLGLAASGVQSGDVQVRTLVVEDRLIMRIPVQPRAVPRLEWIERQGPRCVRSKAIRGAKLSRPGHVDFLLFGGRRVRAELGEDCPALDFYTGFYLTPDDERICAERDSIRSRMGGSCRIERFHQLVPRRRQVP